MDNNGIGGSIRFECETDEEAKTSALALVASCSHVAAEVWNLARFVCRVHHSDAVAAGLRSAQIARPGDHCPGLNGYDGTGDQNPRSALVRPE